MASTKVRGITIELNADTTGISQGLKTVNSEIGSTQKQLKDVERLLKLDPGNTELLEQKQRLLNDRIGETKTKLETLKKAQQEVEKTFKETGEGQEQYDALTREIQSCERELKDLEKQAGKAEVAMQKIAAAGDKMKDLGGKISDVGSKLTRNVTTPLIGATAASAKAAVDFETAMTGVKKTNDELVDSNGKVIISYDDLAESIKELSTTTASSKDEIARVMEAAGQLGVGTQYLTEFTKTMIMLGDSTNLSAEDAASAIAKFANVTGMSLDDSQKLGSVIVALGNNFATTESDIVEMATRLAGAGHQIGLSDAQIMGFATALSSVGIEAEMGGSAFSKAMIKMQVAAETGYEPVQKLLQFTAAEHGIDNLRDLQLAIDQEPKFLKTLGDELGMITKEIKATIDAGGNLNSFAETANMTTEEFVELYRSDAPAALQAFISGLGDTESHGESTIAMLQEMGFTEVRLRDTLTRLAGSGDLLTRAVEMGSEAWEENTALTEEAEKKYDTMAAQMNQAKEKASNLGIEIGERLMPYIDKALDTVDKLIDAWDGLSTEEQDQIVQVALVAAALGPLLMALGNVITTVGSILSLAPQISSFASFIVANPIGLIIAAVVALYALIALKGDEIQKVLQKVDDFVQNIFAKDWTKTFGFMGEPLNTFLAHVRSIWNAVTGIMNGMIDFIRGVFTGDWERAWKGVKEIFKAQFDALSLVVKVPLNAVIGMINTVIGAFDMIADKINGFSFNIPEVFGGGELSVHIPTFSKIPYLAKGGILSQGSAVVGEAGAELLTMVNGRAVVQPLTTNNNNYAGATNNFYIQSNDPYAVAEQVSEILEHQTNQMREAWA